MAVYVNQSASPKTFNVGTAVYSFPAGGYVPATATAIAELSFLVASGELIAWPDNWLISNSIAELATRLSVQSSVSLSSVATALTVIAEQNQVLQAAVEVVEQEVYEAEKHFHNHEYWYGLHPAYVSGVTCGSRISMTPYALVSGNDAYGAWYCLLGTQDTPAIAGNVWFDPHRLSVTDVDTIDKVHRFQFACATEAAAIAAGDVSEIAIIPRNLKFDPGIYDVMDSRYVAGVCFWARLWVDGENADAANFFFGIHEYLR